MVNIFANFFLITLVLFFFSACVKSPFTKDIPSLPVYNNLSVHFIDVGEGDCIFINLPDDKTALIDCGESSEENYEMIDSALKLYSVDKIDYFILTHPHSDHVGNAKKIAENYKIERVFISKLQDNSLFPAFNTAVEYFEEREINVEISSFYKSLGTEEYTLVFLYPEALEFYDSAYSKLCGISNPTDEDVNGISAVIYLEYNGVRFLFTSDANKVAQENITRYYKTGILNKTFFNCPTDILLEDIDFIKVSHHGSKDSNLEEFIALTRPKNAVISVGGANNYGHPSDEVINMLKEINSDCNVYRTDYHGSVSAHVDKEGNLAITTFKDRLNAE